MVENKKRQKLRFRPQGVVLNIIIAAIVLEMISALQFYHTQQLLADELEKRGLTILAGIIILGFIIAYFIKNNRKLNITKKEKALIDKELHIASNIQMQMLPKQTVIPSGTTILLFTDGLTEAKNLMNKQFGLKRVIEAVNGHEQSSTKELLEIITGKVRAFTQGAPQSDDLTMMAIRYTPQMEEDTLNETLLIKNHIKDVEQLNVFVGNITQQLGYEEDEARCIRLAVEEAVVNVISYAYSEGQEGDISIVAQANSKRLQFIITDSGIPFDPTEASQVDITLPAEERRIGGLGIHLVRELMDSINYERENGKNILTLVKKIPKIKK